MEVSLMYFRWYGDKMWLFVPVQQMVGKFAGTFVIFPLRQRSASFNIDPIMEQLQRGAGPN